ncbi:3-hydroxyanthranilic acid dioxygenase [Gonapodya prolifera JEL478]|uniref:3-hydroxyanthranilate 3,4-dioxygenase n=1 Tax=Gonapodya prolifera (strain JEL478) TaxID=1344416 RepID=A0A139A0Z7_GONPJ|nr:3-hydroxyanthranilic acid dioxygenase [Gonapodya prolifera JEL478]|eukprot:KXS10449.1 3-hydroxyanthranilic acid dioxygenase [Gonapodya prolifera JEL478]
MPLATPINFPKWLSENEHLLKPPVSNKLMQRGDFQIMIVGGPNGRTDYHINPTEEWFYQYKGNMTLRVVEDGSNFKDITLSEGDMFLLPRMQIIIERNRPTGHNDILRWYCDKCRGVVYQDTFYCTDLGTQLKPVIERWANTPEIRTCPHCGHANPAK